MEDTQQPQGAFIESLVRTNTKIKRDRAEAIQEAAQTTYKRTVEDLEALIKRKKRDRENMLDMSPDNTHSLIVASDFDDKDFTNKDLEMSVDIRNLEIKLEIARRRYAYLFEGGEK